MEKSDIYNWLQEVEHPAKEGMNLLQLGMVDAVEVAEGRIHVTLAFPKRPDPLKNYLIGAAQACLYRHAPGGTEIAWRLRYDEGVDPDSPEVRRRCAQALARLREQMGV